MSVFGKLMTLFPALHTSLVVASFVLFVFEPSLNSFLTIPATIYLFPLLAYRIHQMIVPVIEGTKFGTRTNTIITVDKENNLTFVERTKTHLHQSPLEWSKSIFKFKIEENS